jgi:hypothetical protein
MVSATASIGMLMLWSYETGLQQVDKYMYAEDPQIKVFQQILFEDCSLIRIGWCCFGDRIA